MKKAITAVLCAILISGCAAAQAEEDPAGTGIRVRNGEVQVLNDEEWESIGSVSALQEALEEYDAKETAQASASPSESPEASASLSASADAEALLSFTTGEDGELYLNGEATGYRLVKEETKESPEASASASASEASDYLNLETKENGEMYLNGAYTGYRLVRISDVLNDVNITFITSDGDEIGSQSLELAAGTYTGKIEAPEGYQLAADDNTLVVSEGDNERIVIVKKEESGSSDGTYDVVIHFKNTDDEKVEDQELQLAAGTYSTDITDYKGKDHTIIAPEGYVCLKPEEIKISRDTELDIIVKEGARCGNYAHWGPSSNACVCDAGYTGDPYEAACAKKS